MPLQSYYKITAFPSRKIITRFSCFDSCVLYVTAHSYKRRRSVNITKRKRVNIKHRSTHIQELWLVFIKHCLYFLWELVPFAIDKPYVLEPAFLKGEGVRIVCGNEKIQLWIFPIYCSELHPGAMPDLKWALINTQTQTKVCTQGSRVRTSPAPLTSILATSLSGALGVLKFCSRLVV